MGKAYLGEFEELVLTMVGILQEEAYGNAIVNEIRQRAGRAWLISARYTLHCTGWKTKALLNPEWVGRLRQGAADVKGFSVLPTRVSPCFVL